MTSSSVLKTLERARARLLAERVAAGHWVGELSTSALSTATATAALAVAGYETDRALVRKGRAWLTANANADGGYGDTTSSPSNPSTTALAWMALGVLPFDDEPQRHAHGRAAAWLRNEFGGLDARTLAAGLARIYGDDRTFAVPILVACAIGGCFEGEADPWRVIPSLPYELAAFPQRAFKWMRLSVVSYALPALVAIGQAQAHHAPSRNPIARAARGVARKRTLRVLERIQPENGGFLEATPLTSFVVMSLVAAGNGEHAVTQRGLEFLRASVREDGSWPIDTNLATWVTTLSLNALAAHGALEEHLDRSERERLLAWLLDQQLGKVHPYTGAAPGGWAWTDLPGGVPDADDTPGALLALCALSDGDEHLERAARGVRWLVDLQNRDGGIPTFCRGWGKLPFDQSCPDLTAHVLRAFEAWRGVLPEDLAERVERSADRARSHLIDVQRADGAWLPLWFGNQSEPRQSNPLYGTSRVLRAASVPGDAAWRGALERGVDWLLACQAESGGFGAGPGVEPSIEETGLGLEALVDAIRAGVGSEPMQEGAIDRACDWLAQATAGGRTFEPTPIGLYFARLWYSERLYPLVFTVSALGAALALRSETSGAPH